MPNYEESSMPEFQVDSHVATTIEISWSSRWTSKIEVRGTISAISPSTCGGLVAEHSEATIQLDDASISSIRASGIGDSVAVPVWALLRLA